MYTKILITIIKVRLGLNGAGEAKTNIPPPLCFLIRAGNTRSKGGGEFGGGDELKVIVIPIKN